MKKLIVFSVCVLVAALTGALAEAAPIDPNITITGSATYDTGFSFVDNASHSGTMTVTVGGATTTTNYLDGTVGANPLNGTLTDTGDGFGCTGFASASAAVDDAEFGIGIDITMTIANTSLTDIYDVTIGIAYGNTVDSAGTDAYVDSEFTLDRTPPGIEEFFTDLITDTVNGNEVGGNPVSGFGGPLTDSGTDTLVLTLNPGDSYVIDGDWTMEGGAYADATSVAFLDDFYVQLTIVDVIPEPTTLGLLLIGGLALLKLRK